MIKTFDRYLLWFEEISKHDISLVGGKGANLGEMINAGFPVPYGFVVTANAYRFFLDNHFLRPKIAALLSNLDYENPNQLHQVSKTIKEMIFQASIPESLLNLITKYYELLPEREARIVHRQKDLLSLIKKRVKHLFRSPLVAVRSSATAEELPKASFAGQQETFLNVQGEAELILAIKKCWASLFNERAIYYRFQQKFDHNKVNIAVVVQRMVQSDRSGIAFTVDPLTANKRLMIIEGIFGLGEYIVSGKVTPDHYEVDKKSFLILKKQIAYQKVKLIKKGKKNQELRLTPKEGKKQKLSDEEILKIAITINEIENHYYFPQDIEWAIEGDNLYIVQSRPITTLNKIDSQIQYLKDKAHQLILTGSPASPGIAFGPVVILHHPSEINRVKNGDILVATQTNPDYVPAMKKAVAIVTDKGGRTSHAAIVSRELGIPAVVGTEKATKVLKEGQIVTVNGTIGEVYLGKVTIRTREKEEKMTQVKTITKIYVNLAQVDEANHIARENVDGVGLLRAEFMIADIGVHPRTFVKENKEHIFINKMAKNLLTFARAFNPRPVIYRATDFKTNEYRHLKNGHYYELKEENPMLGFRGAIRFIQQPEVFMMELMAIKKVWQEGLRNLFLMIPFIRAPWELVKIKEIVKKSGLNHFLDFKLFMMVEVPATALTIEDYLKIGIDGLSIGSNDLTMMLLGVDRDNEEIAHFFDERAKVVIETINYVISEAKKYSVPVSICGQAPSDYPEIVEELVRAGISSISVNPDVINQTRQIVYEVERKIFAKK